VVSWQTVVLSISAALITGTAAITVAWMNMRSQRRQQAQTRRVEAASDFSKQLAGATNAVGFALDHPEAVGNAAHLVGEAGPLLGPVSLLFGAGSDVTQDAAAAVAELENAVRAIESGDGAGAAAALNAGALARERFEHAARRVVD
jgi:ABC-type Fe3+ transport system permease subunit